MKKWLIYGCLFCLHILPWVALIGVADKGLLSLGIIIPIEMLAAYFNAKYFRKAPIGQWYLGVMQLGMAAGLIYNYARHPARSYPEALGGVALAITILINFVIVWIVYGFASTSKKT